jgi:hypothetical protein
MIFFDAMIDLISLYSSHRDDSNDGKYISIGLILTELQYFFEFLTIYYTSCTNYRIFTVSILIFAKNSEKYEM